MKRRQSFLSVGAIGNLTAGSFGAGEGGGVYHPLPVYPLSTALKTLKSFPAEGGILIIKKPLFERRGKCLWAGEKSHGLYDKTRNKTRNLWRQI
jgi:hypothetical protein